MMSGMAARRSPKSVAVSSKSAPRSAGVTNASDGGAERCYRKALDLFLAAGDAAGVARAAGNLGAVYLDTFTFQAPAFYEKHGYREFGRLDDAVHGHARIWLAKRL